MPATSRSAAIYHVLYADTVGYTRHSLDAKAIVDQALRSAVAAQNDLDAPRLTVDTGDGFFMVFEGDPQAVCRAAIRLRHELSQRCAAKVRIGLHSGLGILRDDLKAGINITGPAVERAQRVMTLAAGDEILVSDELAAHLLEFEEWRGWLKWPRPAPTKDGAEIVVWELAEESAERRILAAIEADAPTDSAARIQSALPPSLERAVWIPAPHDLEGAANLARCARHYSALVIAGSRSGWLGRAFFADKGISDFGIGVAAGESSAWFGEAQGDELGAALRALAGISTADKLHLDRAADRQFREAITRGSGIILVRAPRFSGKTTLLLRGLIQARNLGWKTVVTDFRAMERGTLASQEELYRAIARSFAAQRHASSEALPDWRPELGLNINLETVVQAALSDSPEPTLWVWDSVERLFEGEGQDDLFGLLRSWHNRRAWDDQGVWPRLSIALAYSNDAERLIRNPKQSPFNVGTRIDLTDFSLDEFAKLNDLAGSPLMRPEDIRAAHALTGGDPSLSRILLEGISAGQLRLAELLDDRWPEGSGWGRHMTVLQEAIIVDADAQGALRSICQKARSADPVGVLRLVHLGILKPNLAQKPAFRNQAYERMFNRLLG